jgi:heme oxygenase (mycobilin-producing)
MYLAVSSFSVMNDLGDSVREAFLSRPHLVDNAAGFIRMEVANPNENPNEFWLFTWWEKEINFQDWYSSHAFQDSHNAMPKSLKLLPNKPVIMGFNIVAH